MNTRGRGKRATPDHTSSKRARPSPLPSPTCVSSHIRKSRRRAETPVGESSSSLPEQPIADLGLGSQPLQLQRPHTPSLNRHERQVWSESETKSLIEFMVTYSAPRNCWPGTSKKLHIWSSAAKFVNNSATAAGSRLSRSGLCLLMLL